MTRSVTFSWAAAPICALIAGCFAHSPASKEAQTGAAALGLSHDVERDRYGHEVLPRRPLEVLTDFGYLRVGEIYAFEADGRGGLDYLGCLSCFGQTAVYEMDRALDLTLGEPFDPCNTLFSQPYRFVELFRLGIDAALLRQAVSYEGEYGAQAILVKPESEVNADQPLTVKPDTSAVPGDPSEAAPEKESLAENPISARPSEPEAGDSPLAEIEVAHESGEERLRIRSHVEPTWSFRGFYTTTSRPERSVCRSSGRYFSNRLCTSVHNYCRTGAHHPTR